MSAFEDIASRLAAVIAVQHNPKTVPDLQFSYDASALPAQPKVRVLIVPGHEPDYGGAEYDSGDGHVRERDLAAELAQHLAGFFKADSHYETFVSRDADAWSSTFANYFDSQMPAITAWKDAHKAAIESMIKLGEFKPVSSKVEHNDAPDPVALRLYGISKWANENKIDLVIHIHFNDYPHASSRPGKYTGFAIYVPEKQYGNSTTTRALASYVYERLKKYVPVSDMPAEQTGLVEDQDLIAVGALDSLDAPSMLMEYSYIYEPQVTDPEARSLYFKELAYETYRGVQDFLDSRPASDDQSSDTLMLPHVWKAPVTDKSGSTADIFALQTALIDDGEYPPKGKTMNDCPRTGAFKSCTKSALQEFQNKYGIKGEKGIVGGKTADKLNELFAARSI